MVNCIEAPTLAAKTVMPIFWHSALSRMFLKLRRVVCATASTVRQLWRWTFCLYCEENERPTVLFAASLADFGAWDNPLLECSVHVSLQLLQTQATIPDSQVCNNRTMSRLRYCDLQLLQVCRVLNLHSLACLLRLSTGMDLESLATLLARRLRLTSSSLWWHWSLLLRHCAVNGLKRPRACRCECWRESECVAGVMLCS
jgi:hypothetical protein